MKRSCKILLLSFMFLSVDKVFALKGDLFQGLDITDNNNGTYSADGWALAHGYDNTNFTFEMCDSSGNNCSLITRNDNEDRTEMNKEVTEGQYYDYSNIGINQTFSSAQTTLFIRDKNGNVVAKAKVIDKNSTDAGIRIGGTNCDLRSESGNRTNGDYAHFKTGETFSINSVKNNVATDKGDVVTMYCVGVSNNYEEVNGHRYYSPGNDSVKCVFDSCGILTEDDNVEAKPPQEDNNDYGECGGMGGFNGCSMNSSSIGSCGGSTNHVCNNGTYTTGSIYSPSNYGSAYRLLPDQAECKSATCRYSQRDVFSLSISFPQNNLYNEKYNAYLAGTYFNNPTLGYFVDSNISNVKAGNCPTWAYEYDYYEQIGGYETYEACRNYCDDYGGSCVKTSKKTSILGNQNNKEEGKDDEKKPSYTCKYMDTRIVYLPSRECQSGLQARCDYEIGRQASSGGSASATGSATFATDSNDYTSGKTYTLPFNSLGNSVFSNIAYVKKSNGYVTYYQSHLNADEQKKYNIYNNVHFIPSNYPSIPYNVNFNGSFAVTSNGSRYTVGFGAVCGVNVVNLFTPDSNSPIHDSDNDSGGHGFIYRPIELAVPFPNSEIDGCTGSKCRSIGSNWYTWIKDVNNQKDLADYYGNGPDYVVELNNQLISSIRNYNKQKNEDGVGYLDNSINIDGSSNFLKDSSSVGICAFGSNSSTLCNKYTDYYGLGLNKPWGGK